MHSMPENIAAMFAIKNHISEQITTLFSISWTWIKGFSLVCGGGAPPLQIAQEGNLN